MFYGTTNCENKSSVTSRKDFIMQNFFAKSGYKWDRFYNAELLCKETDITFTHALKKR
jgi:hypothetical protein